MINNVKLNKYFDILLMCEVQQENDLHLIVIYMLENWGRLVLACVGGIIGFEEKSPGPAGLEPTYCVHGSLVMITSEYIYRGDR